MESYEIQEMIDYSIRAAFQEARLEVITEVDGGRLSVEVKLKIAGETLTHYDSVALPNA